MNIEFAQIFTQIVSFLIMYWVLKRYAWKPILKHLDDRRNKIQSDFDGIEEQKKGIDLLIQEYNTKLKEIDVESRRKLQEALEEGRKEQTKIQNEAHAQAKEILLKAEKDVQREINQAKEQLQRSLSS